MYTHTAGTLKLSNFISGTPPKKFENPCTVVQCQTYKIRGKINSVTHLLRVPTIRMQLVLAGSQHLDNLGNRLSLVTEFNTSPTLTDISQYFN